MEVNLLLVIVMTNTDSGLQLDNIGSVLLHGKRHFSKTSVTDLLVNGLMH
jgi:hypothetical protein